MFGGDLEPPKYVKRTRPKPMTYDIQLPGTTPAAYGHFARQPNTDYHVRYHEYRTHLLDAETQFLAAEAKRLTKEAVTAKYDRHADQKVFQRHIQERFKDKIKTYEESVERRREKLRQLFCKEDQDYIIETVDQAQRGVDSKMQDMKEKAQKLKAQREAERQEIVNEKRRLQLIEECRELRPVLVKRNLVDSKNAQLQQIKENEMKRETERELDHLWYNLMLKEVEAMKEKDAQDLLKKEQIRKETMEIWTKQIQGKQLLKQEVERVAAEDRMEMIKLQEQLRREKIEEFDARRRKRDETATELRKQIAIHEGFIAQRKKEEDNLHTILSQLAQVELERERQKIHDSTSHARRETAIYNQHLKQLEEERKVEEKKLNQLLEEHRKMIEEKQAEAYCKLKKAREELHKNVLAERAQQLDYKKQEAENLLKLKEAENELLRMACETNERLQAEHDRLQAEQVKQYREDLKKQIEYNDEKRKLEKEQLERELAEGLAEEERRRQQVLEIINARLVDESFIHPFRRVLERSTCPCPDKPTDNH